jgi:hypothetical protein
MLNIARLNPVKVPFLKMFKKMINSVYTVKHKYYFAWKQIDVSTSLLLQKLIYLRVGGIPQEAENHRLGCVENDSLVLHDKCVHLVNNDFDFFLLLCVVYFGLAKEY